MRFRGDQGVAVERPIPWYRNLDRESRRGFVLQQWVHSESGDE